MPGIYAYIAILLSCSALFLYDDWISEKYRLLYDNSTDEPLYKRTQRYFRNALGDDIVDVLTHRLMDCISELLVKIDLKVDEFLERLKGSNERKLDERGSMVEEQSELDRTSDKVSGEAIGIDEHRSYFWLLSQLRVYLLAYSSLVSGRPDQLFSGNDHLDRDSFFRPIMNESDSSFPIVCFVVGSFAFFSHIVECCLPLQPSLSAARLPNRTGFSESFL